jgi:transposase
MRGYVYYYLQQSQRINGKVKVTFSKCIGSAKKITEELMNLHINNENKDLTDLRIKLQESNPLSYGAVIALLSVAERNGIRDIINTHFQKREQGMSQGDYMLLAAINRAVAPCSKRSFWDWFNDTSLLKKFPLATEETLSSQSFWNHMSKIGKEQIDAAETDIVKKLVSNYGLETDLLLFDNTNFFAFIDSDTESELAQRGKSKENRTDLRIVGLSIMCSPTHNIPLLHSVYPGNMNDAKRFAELIDSMKERIKELKAGEKPDVTLVFDRGNNSTANVEAMAMERTNGYHFVGGLKRNQFPELLQLAKKDFKKLKGKKLGDTKAYRTTKEVHGGVYTIVVTDNPELYNAQIRGVEKNIESCQNKLEELEKKLAARASGKTTRGKGYTVDSVEKKVKEILSKEHMSMIYETSVTPDKSGFVSMSFKLDKRKYRLLKDKILGKSVLFSDRHKWASERIIGAYRAQYHVEECFKQLKDTNHLAFRPIRHFTDNNIRVHAFYCVLALRLCSVMALEFERLGYNISIDKMLS